MIRNLALFFGLLASVAQAYETGPAHTVLRVPSAGGRAKMGAVDVSQSAAVTGILRAVNGGHDSSRVLDNLALDVSVGSNALTVALKDKAGSNPSATSPVRIGMRSSTASSGVYNVRTATAATSLVVSSGSTLGTVSGADEYLHVYALDNSGTIELAISRQAYEDGAILSTTAEGGAGAADSATVVYSTTARSNVPTRLIGRISSNQAAAGTWATAPSLVQAGTLNPVRYPTVQIFLSGSGTYTPSPGVKWAEVELVGGGGGGGGGEYNNGEGSPGSNGTNSTFGSYVTCGPGTGGSGSGGNGGSGGTVTIGSPAITVLAVSGGSGQAGAIRVGGNPEVAVTGGHGGSNPLGGAGGGGAQATGGTAAAANTGAGGGGGGQYPGSTNSNAGAGGGAGAYAKFILPAPVATSYAVGTGGTGGASTAGYVGGNGADGALRIVEHY